MNAEIGIVAIGRNEGERLENCLRSVVERTKTVVYVDSGSSDGSVEFARSVGAEVVDLDLTIPFTAARARNAGLQRIREIAPHVRYIQFIDGDCEVVDGWFEQACAVLETCPGVAIVGGRCRERFPDASIYNRLADLEWNTPIGETTAVGGNALIRIEPIIEAGGFDVSLIAGEEPDLCTRLRALGWKIMRIDAEMVKHDIAMTRFSQWWRRAVRTGYGGLEVTRRHGHKSHFIHQVRSTRRWTLGWLLATLVASFSAWILLRPIAGLAVAGIFVLLPLAQVARVAWKMRRRAGDMHTALVYGGLLMLGKWAELAGQVKLTWNRLLGRNGRLIEYKSVERVTGSLCRKDGECNARF